MILWFRQDGRKGLRFRARGGFGVFLCVSTWNADKGNGRNNMAAYLGTSCDQNNQHFCVGAFAIGTGFGGVLHKTGRIAIMLLGAIAKVQGAGFRA